MILRHVGPRPYILWVGRMPVLFYVPWLTFLPLAGAVGGFLSTRRGGNFVTRVAAALFPAFTMFGLVCLGLIWMGLTGRLDRPGWLYVLLGLFNWTVLPTVALLPGAALFLGKRRT
jgi:hypothetical protein